MSNKILILDIETSPSLAAVWGMWKQNISLTNLLGESEVLCWAAKWEGDESVMTMSAYVHGKEAMIKGAHELLEQADSVVTYNGERFDLKILNQEFLFADLPPPKPYHSIDLLRTVRNRFRGTSNKLDWWLRRLSIGKKTETGGPQLWIDCMKGDAEAWAKMIQYNKDDVSLTELLLKRLRPWVPNYPVMRPVADVDTGELVAVCACGSTHLQSRGYKWTVSGMAYKQYQCQSCGKWHRDRYSAKDKDKSPVVHAGQI